LAAGIAALVGAITLGVLAATVARLRPGAPSIDDNTTPPALTRAASTATARPTAPIDVTKMRPYSPTSACYTQNDHSPLYDIKLVYYNFSIWLSDNSGASK